MKKRMILVGVVLAVILMGFASCENITEDVSISDIEGEYIGSFSASNLLKSAQSNDVNEGQGTAEVTVTGDGQIEVHCFGEEIDTTFMLSYYEQYDSLLVCLTGADFYNMYGHIPGAGHMSGGMMGHMGSEETEWIHHLNDEHQEGDEHFGGFDTQDGTFTYSFHMKEESNPYYLEFHGVKEDSLSFNDIGGTYIGSFSISNSFDSEHINDVFESGGTAEVTKTGDGQIEVHCYGEVIDTTFMLDYYEYNDSVMVCLTGDDFENMYGHMLGDGHMMGGMMGDMGNEETEWMHHMNDEHEAGDEHFGGFNMQDGTFTYSFLMKDESSLYYFKFHGVKQ